MGDIVGDLVCVLRHAGVTSHGVTCVGYAALSPACLYAWSDGSERRHDWGSQVCYEAARMRPDVFEAVVGIVVPVRISLAALLSTT
jgi:soluble epoxide hydrolase / lipid-phosphate phosphatase